MLYYDTDSIFVSRDGEYSPPLGDFLGELTDETDGDDINVCVSGGHKNYAYRTRSGNEVVKVGGFSLIYKNSQLINFSTVKDIVLNYLRADESCPSGLPTARCDICKPPTKTTVVNDKKITRDKYKFKILNKREEKDYQVCYSKKGSATQLRHPSIWLLNFIQFSTFIIIIILLINKCPPSVFMRKWSRDD